MHKTKQDDLAVGHVKRWIKIIKVKARKACKNIGLSLPLSFSMDIGNVPKGEEKNAELQIHIISRRVCL